MPTSARQATWPLSVWAALRGWAEAAYPQEACGMIVRDRNGELRAVRAENLRTHHHPSDAHHAFELDTRELLAVWMRGASVEAFFHSHPDATDVLSSADVDGALLPMMPGNTPQLAHPGTAQVVIAVYGGVAIRASVFEWSTEARSFERVAQLVWCDELG